MAIKKYSKKIKAKLRYPVDLVPEMNDFVQFTHFPYRVNDALYGDYTNETPRGYGGTGPQMQYGESIIQLYMPNSTPGTPNDQEWSAAKFAGDLGQMQKQTLQAAAGAGFVDHSLLTGFSDPGRAVGQMRSGLGDEAARQALLQAATSYIGQDASTALQLGQGAVYNPNIEMLYKMPNMRSFSFSFDFIPKSPAETKRVDDIIYQFKKWSSPEVDRLHRFLSVPHLWAIKYFEAGKPFVRLNKFKYCALSNLHVTENPNSNYHMTIDDPEGAAPVHTSLKLTFLETDIVTRDDHMKALKEGYKRGY